jgi:hypothetical protein
MVSYFDLANETVNYPTNKLFVEGQVEFPEKSNISNILSHALFYLGHREKAKEAAYAYSIFQERKVDKIPREINKLMPIGEAALYRDLSGRKGETKILWNRFFKVIAEIPDEQVIQERRSNYLVQVGYGLMKLGRHKDAIRFASRGQKAIEDGYGIFKEARRNTREYGLITVIRAIIDFELKSSDEAKHTAQQTLQNYKDASAKRNRLGYPVIFNLQQSYPDIFDPVLPGSDPDKD